jgi:hypothetical protein
MELFKIFFFLIILFELVCAGCVSYSSNPVVEDAKDTHAIIGPDYRNQGKGSFVCGKGEMRFSREVIQQTILVLTTAFLLWQTGIV